MIRLDDIQGEDENITERHSVSWHAQDLITGCTLAAGALCLGLCLALVCDSQGLRNKTPGMGLIFLPLCSKYFPMPKLLSHKRKVSCCDVL